MSSGGEQVKSFVRAHHSPLGVEELLDTYIADRNSFLMDRARTYYKKWGRGIMLLELSEAAFASKATVSEMPAPVHYRYLAGDDLAGLPEEERASVDGYDPDKECLVVGRVALDGEEAEFAVRTVKASSPFLEMLRQKGDEIRKLVKSSYRARGRGLLVCLPAPPELMGMGDGYAAMYVPRDSGHPVFKDDTDAALLVDGYDPEREFCYLTMEPDGGSLIGKATFGGNVGTAIAGWSDHEDTKQYAVGRFASQDARPTAQDAIFGGKPKNERSH